MTYRDTASKIISFSVDYFFHRAKGGDREGYIEIELEKERTRWRVRDPHNLEREASTDHPIGEGLG